MVKDIFGLQVIKQMVTHLLVLLVTQEHIILVLGEEWDSI